MQRRTFIRSAFYLSALIWMVGCSMGDPTDQIKGWKCVYACDMARTPDVNADLDKHLSRDYKPVLDDSRAFLDKLKSFHGIKDDQWDPNKAFGLVNGKLYEDGTGRHSMMYLVNIRSRWTDRYYVYVLVYDKFNKRIKVSRGSVNNPYRCCGPQAIPSFTRL